MSLGDDPIRFGPLVLTRTSDFHQGQPGCRMEFEECKPGVWVWTWPLWNRSRERTPAEELAQMLALIDGGFEIRRLERPD